MLRLWLVASGGGSRVVAPAAAPGTRPGPPGPAGAAAAAAPGLTGVAFSVAAALLLIYDNEASLCVIITLIMVEISPQTFVFFAVYN